MVVDFGPWRARIVNGSEHVDNLLRLEGVELAAGCDIRPEACAAAQRQAEKLGKRKPGMG